MSLIGIYSITCIQRPLKGSNEIGLLQEVIFNCRFYLVDSGFIVSDWWSLNTSGI